MNTNANSTLISALLADANVGTFTGLVTTKRGIERGPRGNKVRYGDDTVHVCIFTGFKYKGLRERSLEMLVTISDDDVFADAQAEGIKAWSGYGKNAVQVELTLADFVKARAELEKSLRRSKPPTNGVFEPLVVDGKVVRGSRVYKGQTDASKKRGYKPAAMVGTIYLQGLKISSRVLIPAVNGPKPASKSKATVVAKDLLQRNLPISRYVSYPLQPGDDWLIRSGGTAAVAAEKDGIHFTQAVKDAIKRSKAA